MTACSTVACISKRHVWHHKTTDSPPSLVTICHKSGDPFPSSGCDVIYGRPPSPKFVCKISTVAMSWMYTSTIATKANAFRTRFICCGRLTLRQYWRDVLCSPGANIARPTQQNSAGEEHRPFNRNAVGVVSGSMHWRSSLWQTLRWPLEYCARYTWCSSKTTAICTYTADWVHCLWDHYIGAPNRGLRGLKTPKIFQIHIFIDDSRHRDVNWGDFFLNGPSLHISHFLHRDRVEYIKFKTYCAEFGQSERVYFSKNETSNKQVFIQKI